MPTRARIMITVLAAIAAVSLLIPMAVGAYHAATRPPVVITIPPQDAASRLPYGGTQVANSSSSSSPKAAPSTSTAPVPAGQLFVHVAGAVKHPSVYKLAQGARVFDAVHAAGGTLPKADTDAVNLAELVHDGEKVYVPAKGETDAAGLAGSGNDVGHAPAGGSDTEAHAATAGAKSAHSRSGGNHVAKLTNPAAGKIAINSAGADQLERLPGVGPAMAQRIISTRSSLGGFRKATDLLYVTGIGPKKYKKIAPYIKL